MEKKPNKLAKNIITLVVVVAFVIVVKKYWLPDGIIGLFE
ncbi:hypothetical protein J2Z47_006116 [Cohnella thailandensis]|nr:hypothetical protein [Cohnella thailandensis]